MGKLERPCVATAIEVVASDHLDVTFDAPRAGICTADMAATTHTFDLPLGITKSPVTTTINYRDWDGTDTVTLD